MTLEQLQYFVVSAESGSFSSAAEQLYVSHSSVSRGVSALERELGTPLLVRGKRQLQCTPAGELILRQGKDMLQQAVRMKDSVARFRPRSRLQLVSIGAYMPRFYALLRDFRQSHPQVELVMEQMDQRTVVEKLRRGEADLGVIFSYSWPQDTDFDSLVVEQGRFCALVPQNHPFSHREFLTRAELADSPELLGENPFSEEPQHRSEAIQDVQSIIMQIKAGDGITVLPEHAAVEFGQGCVQVPICGATDGYQLLLGWRRTNTAPWLMEMIAFFRLHLQTESKVSPCSKFENQPIST